MVNRLCNLAANYTQITLRNGCSQTSLLRYYEVVIRPVLSYGCAAQCNMSASTFTALTKLECRAAKIIGRKPRVHLREVCVSLCENLYKEVERYSRHPLRVLFRERSARSQRSLRSRNTLCAPTARTNRLRDSFINYS